MLILYSSNVYAQNVPSSADSSRVHQNTPQLLLPKPDIQAPLKKGEITPTPVPEGAELYSFKLYRVELDDMTAYKDADIAPLYSNIIGRDVSFADILALADKITVKYRNDGYVLSRVIVPAQKINNGLVRLQVLEGHIDNVIIEGDAGNKYTKKLINKYLRPVKSSKPLQMKKLEHALLLINDLAGVSARNVIVPSTEIAGAADLKIILEKAKKITSFMQVDNRGSRYLGPLQSNSAMQFSNIFKRNEAINLQMMTTPQSGKRELDYVSLSYSEKVGGFGTSFSVNGSITSTKPGFELSEFEVKGISNSMSLALQQPLIRSRTTNVTADLSLEMNNTTRKDNLSVVKIKDSLRVLRAGINAKHFDSLSGISSGNLRFSHGLNMFGARETGTANMTRADGVSDFFKVNGELSRTQRLSDKVQLVAAVSGQKSAHILLSSEEFGVGGASYGRAYDGSEITGEDGVAAKVELHLYNPYAIKWLDSYQFYTWYDVGRVWDRDNSIVKDKQRSLASTGLGVQSNFAKGMSLTAEFGLPLTRDVEVSDNTNPRLFVTLSARF